MRTSKVLSVTVLIIVVGFISVNIFAHNTGVMNDKITSDKVTTKVENVEGGIQIAIISDDKEIAAEIQENAPWYKKWLSRDCGYIDHDDHGHGWNGHHMMRHM